MSSQHATQPPTSATRRDFLKTSATVASGVTLGGLALSRSAHAAGSDVIKIGMIGSGSRCSGAAVNAMNAGKDVQLVAMCDVFEDRLQSSRNVLEKQFEDQVKVDDDHCFLGFDGYQKVIDSSDVVLIACATKYHPMYAEAAIKANKHVFVEKPHGIDPVGVHRIKATTELAEKKGLSIVSGLQSRFHQGWQETVKRIHDGAIGEIVAMQSMFLRGPYRVYKRPENMSETEYQFYNWYHFRWLSGDDVPQSLVHNVDRMSWIMKEATPDWAFGLGGRSASFGEEYGDMFDHHTVVYEYPQGARLYALCRTQANCYGNSSDIIMGSKGTCYLTSRKPRIEGENSWVYEGPENNPYDAEQAALIESVRTGKPINSGYHMAHSTMITVLGQLACYGGVKRTFEEVNGCNLQFGPAPEDSSFETTPPTLPEADGNYPLPMPGLRPLEFVGDLA